MLFALLLTLSLPTDWVPARWHWLETKTLELIAGTPVNCLLVDWDPLQKAQAAAFAGAAAERGIATLAVIRPGGDPAEPARDAIRAKLTGVVLEGDFPPDATERVRAAVSPAPLIELTLRSRMPLGNKAPVIGTWQGVWPGIPVMEDGAAKAGPSGSPWINTNAGFLRAARAFGDSILPVVKTGQALLVGDDYALDDGLWFEAYPGHTPGNVVIHAKSGGERGIFIGDVLHHPLQCLKPEWSTMACTDPDGSRVSRTRLVEEHADNGALVLPAHFPAPTSGWIRRYGSAYRFDFRE